MNFPSQPEQHNWPEHDLIGFVLGALETEQHEQLHQLTAEDPILADEVKRIKAQVAPLDGLDPPGTPPVGLARRTCERIAPITLPAIGNRQNVQATRRSRSRWFSERREVFGGRQTWSISDVVVASAVAIVLVSITLPAIRESRFQSRLAQCQDNMRQAGMAMLEYASRSGGRHLAIPSSGNLSAAGSYAPQLCEAGFIDNPNIFLCAGRGEMGRLVPSCQEIMSARDEELVRLQKLMGGDFASTLGYQKNGRYVAPTNRSRSDYLLLADMPSVDMVGRASRSHSGRGQNGFFEDGHYRFLKRPVVDEDAIYENDMGSIAPGAHANDIVVAPSGIGLNGMFVE